MEIGDLVRGTLAPPPPPATPDRDLNTRIVVTTVDMGAYESRDDDQSSILTVSQD